jgi:hypothetical protein
MLSGATNNYDNVALIEFDLSSIPSGVIITSARITVTVSGVSGSGNYGVHQIVSSWSETSVSWNYDATWKSAAENTQSISSKGTVSWTITNLVQSWVDGSQNNYGVAIWAGAWNVNRYIDFCSIECSSSSDHPKLTINYEYPPRQPSNPSPSNGATGISTGITLSWSCSDPEGDALTYTVFLGTSSSLSRITSGLSATSYNPGTLAEGTKYYWQIFASDGYATTKGPLWSFTTVMGNPPTIQVTSMKGKTGTLVVSFTTADLDNDQLVTTNWQYSMDGKNWVNIAPEAIGNNPARTPGSYTISWDTTVGANSLSGIEDKDVWFRMSVLEYGKSRAVPVQSNVYGSFEVDNYNWRPVWNKTPIVQLDEDTKLSLSLTDYAFDGDNDPLSFFLVTPPSSSFGVSLIGSSGNTLSVNPSINFSGSANFILRVSDGLLSSNVNAAIVIRPVNDPPTIAVIPGFTLSEDTSLDPATDLKDYVYDSDNFLNELSYSVQSMSHPEIGAYINLNSEGFSLLQN